MQRLHCDKTVRKVFELDVDVAEAWWKIVVPLVGELINFTNLFL